MLPLADGPSDLAERFARYVCATLWRVPPTRRRAAGTRPCPARARGLQPARRVAGPGRARAARAAAGRVAAESVIPYPPGLPAILPGERIDAALVTALEAIVAGGGTIGGAGDGPPTLAVVAGGPRRTATAGALRRIR